MREVITHKKGQTIFEQMPEFNWPLLFRGGISYGECHPGQVTSLLNGQEGRTTILLGKALIEAVQLEGKAKGNGPMLMCSKSFYDSLSREGRKYVVKVQDHYEILWPAFRYCGVCADSNVGFRHESEFDEFFEPAIRWWKACNHLEYAGQYYNFIKLIIRSTLRYYSLDGRSIVPARQYIETSLKKHGLLSKAMDLMKEWG
jgi:hypothetical protein